ncbi:MAG: hypothetical protein V1783_05875, partial [Bacteroidota bacterium]
SLGFDDMELLSREVIKSNLFDKHFKKLSDSCQKLLTYVIADYKADEVFVNTRSKANFNAGVLHYGMELLEKKEYAAALVEFNKLPTSVTANYFAGVANMELNMHEVAIFKFDYVIQDYLNLFYDQAQWYKGLCLVKLEKKKEAIALFEQIGMSESYFKEKAKEIVTDLRKN